MAHPTVLRVPRVGHNQDDDPEFVLVQVVSSAGHNDLDIKLIGTQSTSVFSVSCKITMAIATTTGSTRVNPGPPTSCINLNRS